MNTICAALSFLFGCLVFAPPPVVNVEMVPVVWGSR